MSQMGHGSYEMIIKFFNFHVNMAVYAGNNSSSRQTCSIKIDILKNFAKFTGKHLCQNLFFNKVADLMPASLLKKRLWDRFFPLNFAKLLRTPF